MAWASLLPRHLTISSTISREHASSSDSHTYLTRSSTLRTSQVSREQRDSYILVTQSVLFQQGPHKILCLLAHPGPRVRLQVRVLVQNAAPDLLADLLVPLLVREGVPAREQPM